MTNWKELTVAVYGPKGFPFETGPLGWFTLENVTIAEAEAEAKARYPEAIEIEIEIGGNDSVKEAA